MPLLIKSVTVFENGVVHSEFFGTAVHFFNKSVLASADMLRKRNCRIIGRYNNRCLYHIIRTNGFAFFKPNVTSAHSCGVFGCRNFIVKA